MHLHKEGEDYLLIFESDDRRPVTETCRELIGRIATNDNINGEVVYTTADALAMEFLASVAIHINTKRDRPLILSPEELTMLEIAIGHFSPIESAKRAIDEEKQRSGVLSNTRFEARVDLGRRAAGFLMELKEQRLALDNNASAETFGNAIEDGGLAGS